jgi:predicted nucleic acid-binding protein
MNVVDSSAWIEFFVDGANAKYYAKPIQDVDNLLVPTISIYEVFKCILKQGEMNQALQAVALMEQGRVIKLDSHLALSAAVNACEFKLPMADSIIFTTAKLYGAHLWTQDVDFKNIAGVHYFEKT